MSTLKDPMEIRVRLYPRIRVDGELIRVIIAQGDSEINLTQAQAQTLCAWIERRLPKGSQ